MTVELVGNPLDGDLHFRYLGIVKGLSVASEVLLRGDILEEHQDGLHVAGGHVQVDVPEGVRLVYWHLSVPQYPVIQDRKAAFVLVVDRSDQLWQSDAAIGRNPGINEAEPITSKGEKAFQGKIASPAGTVHKGPQPSQNKTRVSAADNDGASAEKRQSATAQEEEKTALVADLVAGGLAALWLSSRYLDHVVVTLDIARMECLVARRQIEPTRSPGVWMHTAVFSDSERCYLGCQRARQSRLRYLPEIVSGRQIPSRSREYSTACGLALPG